MCAHYTKGRWTVGEWKGVGSGRQAEPSTRRDDDMDFGSAMQRMDSGMQVAATHQDLLFS